MCSLAKTIGLAKDTKKSSVKYGGGSVMAWARMATSATVSLVYSNDSYD